MDAKGFARGRLSLIRKSALHVEDSQASCEGLPVGYAMKAPVPSFELFAMAVPTFQMAPFETRREKCVDPC
jgi:hypothetical protein